MSNGTGQTLSTNINKPFDIGSGHMVMFDEDYDMMWFHESPEHKGWQYLDTFGIHRAIDGDVDDVTTLTIPNMLICSTITCGVQGHITKGQWVPAPPSVAKEISE